MGRDPRRRLPSVDSLLRNPQAERWLGDWGRSAVVEALRAALNRAREEAARDGVIPGDERLLADAGRHLDKAFRARLRGVLNGTGVVLHTNLGRAPLASEALEAVQTVAGRYCNLEYELAEGGRGDRYAHCVELVRELTGAEDALVVNNNAAAVALAINELASGREVLVSRGELVEIGGSFRVPDVVRRAGGYLVEVGTTNRTRIEDYRRAATPSTGVLLRVHPSNYRVRGFVEEASLADLVALGRDLGIPVIHDLGSGQLLPVPNLGEPRPQDSVRLGVEVVTWSGDKLLGGPQAGVIHGAAAALGRLRGNPLLRAFRVDKMTLAALEATLMLYRHPERAVTRIPALRMLAETAPEVENRARAALVMIPDHLRVLVHVRSLTSLAGGGALPEIEFQSAGWAVEGMPPARLDAECRRLDPPLIGRVEDDEFRVDFRTILPGEEADVARVVAEVLERTTGASGPGGGQMD
jgi:L-seryl-tRNA(Ser) seleniumtransferase